jgi:hypothetical protein
VRALVIVLALIVLVFVVAGVVLWVRHLVARAGVRKALVRRYQRDWAEANTTINTIRAKVRLWKDLPVSVESVEFQLSDLEEIVETYKRRVSEEDC